MTTKTLSNTPIQCGLMRAAQLRFHSNGRRFDPYLPSQKKTPSLTGFLFLPGVQNPVLITRGLWQCGQVVLLGQRRSRTVW
jgi:hypothetical protein